VSKDSDQTEAAPRKFKLGPLGSLNQVTKVLAKTIRAMADGTLDSQVSARICNGLGIMRACLETQTAIMDDARTWSHAFLFSPYGAGSRRHLDETFSAPEVLKPIWGQLGVPNGVLDVFVPEPGL
jgi:hypothetical protein